jgi:hypothetical protein
MPGTVTVGCKIPNGIIIRAFRMVPRQELLMGGSTRETKLAEPFGEPIKIVGPGRIDRTERGPHASGYALTFNVDADVWDAWHTANQDTDMIRNQLVIAHAKQVEVSATARANEGRRSGLEPINPHGDTRSPNRRQELKAGAVSEIAATRAA